MSAARSRFPFPARFAVDTRTEEDLRSRTAETPRPLQQPSQCCDLFPCGSFCLYRAARSFGIRSICIPLLAPSYNPKRFCVQAQAEREAGYQWRPFVAAKHEPIGYGQGIIGPADDPVHRAWPSLSLQYCAIRYALPSKQCRLGRFTRFLCFAVKLFDFNQLFGRVQLLGNSGVRILCDLQ